MFKSKIMKELIDFFDDVFSLLGLAFGVILGFVLICVVGGFAHHYFPTATEITLWIIGIFLVLAFIGWSIEMLQSLTKQLKSNKAAK